MVWAPFLCITLSKVIVAMPFQQHSLPSIRIVWLRSNSDVSALDITSALCTTCSTSATTTTTTHRMPVDLLSLLPPRRFSFTLNFWENGRVWMTNCENEIFFVIFSLLFVLRYLRSLLLLHLFGLLHHRKTLLSGQCKVLIVPASRRNTIQLHFYTKRRIVLQFTNVTKWWSKLNIQLSIDS